jgi:hypothetical protein
MMATQELREYVMELLTRPDYSVRLNERTRPRIEALPTAEWWDLSRAQDGSERLEVKVGKFYYYILYWTRYLVDGWNPDRCVMIKKSSAEGKRIAEMLGAVR